MRGRASIRVGLISVLAALWLVGSARAQQRTSPALEADFDAGLQAFEAGAMGRAIESLKAVVEGDPAFGRVGAGSAAYWLGRAYEADGDLERARTAWEAGLDALGNAQRFDPRLSDAFVRLTFSEQHGADYPGAARAYLGLLESLDAYPYAHEEAALVLAHLERLAIVVPSALRQSTGLDRLPREGLDALAPDAGAQLVRWWRSQDVAPATRNNERVEEHLQRVRYAEMHYGEGDAFDERGAVYLRLGPPSHRTTVPFNTVSFRNKVVDRSLTLHLSDFPENEFWTYEHIDEAARFLFYNAGGGYRLGAVRDLVPSVLRNGLGNTERGQEKARALIRTLEEIYRQLTLYHPNFALIYQDVANYVDLLDAAEFAAQVATPLQADQQQGASPGGSGGALPRAVRDMLATGASTARRSAGLRGSTFNADRPDVFAQSMMMRAHVEDEQSLLARRDYVPHVHSNAFDAVEPLPLLVRLARFLDDDGTTRTEIYWGVPPGGLQPSEQVQQAALDAGYTLKDYLLMTTVVQHTEAFEERVVNHRRHLLRDLADAGDAALAPQTYVARGDTGLFHVAVAWDQYTTMLEEDGAPARRVRAATYRADSLQGISNDPRRLALSDLKPMVVLGRDGGVPVDNLVEAAAFYPFDTLTPQTPLLLYFEVYHLAFGPGDQTQYTVTYQIRRSQDNGGILRFLGRSGEESTSVQTDYAGSDRTAREHILLDFTEWAGRGALEVTVRVTDRVTGQHVERTLSLTLARER